MRMCKDQIASVTFNAATKILLGSATVAVVKPIPKPGIMNGISLQRKAEPVEGLDNIFVS